MSEPCTPTLPPPPMRLFRMRGELNWGTRPEVTVVAPDAATADACMTAGSDSLWTTVTFCEDLGPCPLTHAHLATRYTNAGGYVL